MKLTAWPSEQAKVAAVLNPATVNSTPAYSGTVDMTLFARISLIAMLGDIAAETVDVRLESDTVNTFNDDLTTVVAATQLAADASANDSKQLILEAAAASIKEGHRYVRARFVTGSTSGGPMGAVILGVPFYSDQDQPATVLETKRV